VINSVPGIIELLQRRGLRKGGRTKIVRHKDKRCDFSALEMGQVEAGYQAYQARHVFNSDYIVSCIRLPNSAARNRSASGSRRTPVSMTARYRFSPSRACLEKCIQRLLREIRKSLLTAPRRHGH
jgi:hypothetical protein